MYHPQVKITSLSTIVTSSSLQSTASNTGATGILSQLTVISVGSTDVNEGIAISAINVTL